MPAWSADYESPGTPSQFLRRHIIFSECRSLAAEGTAETTTLSASRPGQSGAYARTARSWSFATRPCASKARSIASVRRSPSMPVVRASASVPMLLALIVL